MNTVEAKHKYHLSKWTPIIRECRNSGMTVKAWCVENNVNEKQFFYWQRRVREELCASVEAQIKEQPVAFAPLQFPDYHKEIAKSASFRPDLVLKIGNYHLEITNQTSPQLLETVLKVLPHV